MNITNTSSAVSTHDFSLNGEWHVTGTKAEWAITYLASQVGHHLPGHCCCLRSWSWQWWSWCETVNHIFRPYMAVIIRPAPPQKRSCCDPLVDSSAQHLPVTGLWLRLAKMVLVASCTWRPGEPPTSHRQATWTTTGLPRIR